jgi:opacity protein-like surface antigen
MFKKLTLLLTFFVSLTFVLNAQNNKTANSELFKSPKSEIGLMVGISNYQGDLVEPAFDFGVSNFAFGAYYGKYFSDKLTGKLSLLVGSISGDDANYESRIGRGFKLEPTSLIGITLSADYYILGENRYRGEDNFALYVNGGLGLALANPEPTGIPEDNAEEEFGSAFGFIIGGGIKQHLSEKFALGLELSYRPVFSDLLDGVSENANPDNIDTYVWLGLTASYQLGDDRNRK